MKIAVLVIGLICIILSVLFIGYGVKYGVVEKKILTNNYTEIVTGRKAVRTGIFYVVIGLFFFIGAILILMSLYLKTIQGII